MEKNDEENKEIKKDCESYTIGEGKEVNYERDGKDVALVEKSEIGSRPTAEYLN